MLQCTICKGSVSRCWGCPDVRKARHERRLRLRDKKLGALLEQVAALIGKLPSADAYGRSHGHPTLHLGRDRGVFDALASVAGARVTAQGIEDCRSVVAVEVTIGRITVMATAEDS